MTESDFLAAGYRLWPSTRLCYEDGLYQRVVKSGALKAYFINAYVYRSAGAESLKFMFEVDFFLPSRASFTVRTSCSHFETIESVEGFFASVYARFECTPDIHNNEQD